MGIPDKTKAHLQKYLQEYGFRRPTMEELYLYKTSRTTTLSDMKKRFASCLMEHLSAAETLTQIDQNAYRSDPDVPRSMSGKVEYYMKRNDWSDYEGEPNVTTKRKAMEDLRLGHPSTVIRRKMTHISCMKRGPDGSVDSEFRNKRILSTFVRKRRRNVDIEPESRKKKINLTSTKRRIPFSGDMPSQKKCFLT
jgi:hypothetical protein